MESALALYRKYGSRLMQSVDDFGKDKTDQHNQAMKRLSEMYHELERNPSADRSFLLTLLEDENPALRSLAAAHCLGLGVYMRQAVRTLRRLARSANSYIAFNAKSTLYIWKEKKRLTF